MFFQRHYLRVTEQMTRNVAYELAYAVGQVEAAGEPPQAARRGSRRSALPLGAARSARAGRARVEPGVDARLLRLHRRQASPTTLDERDRPAARDRPPPTRAPPVIGIGTSAGVLEADGAARPAVGARTRTSSWC